VSNHVTGIAKQYDYWDKLTPVPISVKYVPLYMDIMVILFLEKN